MTTQDPATPPAAPAAGATPGNGTNGTNPPSTPPAAPEGKVTISTEEFSRLSRDAARGRSAQRRSDLSRSRGGAGSSDEGGDPNSELSQARAAQAAAEKRAMQLEVKEKVRGVLERDEFKSLPQSTKNLILQNPAALSQADNVDEALLDIEDWCRDQSILIGSTPSGGTPAGGTPGQAQPLKVETPPTGGGAPAPTKAEGLEDHSKLKGTAKTQAIIRNNLRTAKGIK